MTFKKKNKKWYYILDGKEYEINASMKKDIESQEFFIKKREENILTLIFLTKKLIKKQPQNYFMIIEVSN